MKSKLILIILIAHSFASCAQQQAAPTEKEASTLNMMTSILYMNKSLFEPMQEGMGEPKPKAELPWAPQKADMELDDILARLAQAPVEAKTSFGRTRLCIEARMPEDQAPNTQLLKCTIKRADVKDADGKALSLQDKVDINSGGGSESRLRDGVMVTESYSIITVCFYPETDAAPALPLTGTLELDYSYEGDFEVLSLTAASKGKALSFGENKVEVLGIDQHIASLHITGPKTPFQVANLNAEGQLMGRNFSQKTQGMPIAVATSLAVMDKAVYEVFKRNPGISETAFGEAIHDYLLNKIRNPNQPRPTVTVCRQLAPIGTLVLYRAKPAPPQMMKVDF